MRTVPPSLQPPPPSLLPPSAPAPESVRAILAPLLAIILGTFMAILDTTVVNVALPTLGRVFQTDLRVLQWVITGYMLASAAVIPLAGWFSDRFGAKRMYLAVLALFTVGSVLCAAAQSGPMLVVFRVIQGLGGGMLMPIGMAFLYRVAPPDRRGAVMGAFGVPMLLGPALGPVLSGWLLEFADWRLIFLINLPTGLIALVMGLRALPSLPSQRTVGALDLPGVLLGPLAFASLSYGISESTSAGWTGASTLSGLAVGSAALLAFAARELTAAHPLIELRVFQSRDFTLAIMAQWAAVAGLFGTMFLIPLFLQQVRSYGAFDTGMYTLPQALAGAATMPIGGRLFDRFGVRVPVMSGLTLVGIAMWLLSGLTAGTTGEDLRLPLTLWGAGMGMLMMPLGTHILNSAPRELITRVTSLTGALQNVVASLAIASFATLLQARLALHLVEAGPSPAPPAQASAQAASYGDIYRLAVFALALAFVLASRLRRPSVVHR